MMSKISYRSDKSPIGEVFEFFGAKLKVNEVDIQQRFLEPGRVLINAEFVKSCNINLLCGSLDIDHVIFNGPATIVFWNDGTKTVVKCADGEHYDKRVAIMWCIIKKNFGSVSSINKNLDKLIDDAEYHGTCSKSAYNIHGAEIVIDDKYITNSIKESLNKLFGVDSINKK